MAIWAAVVAGSPESIGAACPPAATLPTAKAALRRWRGCPGVEGVERFRGRLGISSAGEEDRRPHRFGHQRRGGDRPGPVVFADHGDRRRSLGPLVEGKTASATPAALTAGSDPPIRVVLLVAKLGSRALRPFGRGCPPSAARWWSGSGLEPAPRSDIAPTAAAPDDRGDDEDQRQRHEGDQQPRRAGHEPPAFVLGPAYPPRD